MVSIHRPLGYEPNTLTTAPLPCFGGLKAPHLRQIAPNRKRWRWNRSPDGCRTDASPAKADSTLKSSRAVPHPNTNRPAPRNFGRRGRSGAIDAVWPPAMGNPPTQKRTGAHQPRHPRTGTNLVNNHSSHPTCCLETPRFRETCEPLHDSKELISRDTTE